MGFQDGRRADAQGHHADAALGRQLVGGRLERGHPNGRVRLLVRLGQHLAGRYVPEPALPLEVVGVPDLGDHLQGFLPHLAGVAGVDAHAGLLVGGAASGAHIDAAVGEVVHHGDALGDAHRMVVGQDDDAKAQADALGQLAQRAENNFRAWRHAEGGEEVVLDEPDVIEAHLVGQADLLDGFLDDGVVVQLGTLHFVGQAEFHDSLLPLRWLMARLYCRAGMGAMIE